MKKLLFLFTLFIIFFSSVNSQSTGRTYERAVGVKLWDGGGITFKTFLIPNNALELISYFNRYGTRITALYEIHSKVPNMPGLKWYAGPGGHINFYNHSHGYYGDKRVVGVDGVLGLDYKINNAPLNLSFDWQPSFEFADSKGIALNWFGVGIRYVF